MAAMSPEEIEAESDAYYPEEKFTAGYTKEKFGKALHQPLPGDADDHHRRIVGADGNEQQIHYEEYGNPDGEPVFILHGGPGYGTSSVYARIYNPDKYHIILFDQRNAKRSRPSAGEHPEVLEHCTSEQMMEDINKLAETFGVDFSGKDPAKHHRIHLMGGSWGSALGLYYAAHYPERLYSLATRANTLVEPADLNKLHAVDADGVPLLQKEMEAKGQDWGKLRPVWEDFVAWAQQHAPQFGTDYVKAYQHIFRHAGQETRYEAALRWNMIEHLSGDMAHNAEWVREDLKKSMTADQCISYAAIENNWIISVNEGRPGFFSKPGDPHYNWFAHKQTIHGQLLDPLDQVARVPIIRMVHGVQDVVCYMKDTDWLEKELMPRILRRLQGEGKHGADLMLARERALRIERPPESGHMFGELGISTILRKFADEILGLRQQDKDAEMGNRPLFRPR